jgi:hypothetical protein
MLLNPPLTRSCMLQQREWLSPLRAEGMSAVSALVAVTR